MAKIFSKAATVLGRLIKVAMVAIVVPASIGLFQGLREQLDIATMSGGTFREWVGWGLVTYVVVHLILYRPVGVFQVSRRLFGVIAVWLFGGQVASVEGGADGGSAKGSKKGRGSKVAARAEGSPLVAFSPYVIPLYTVLICAAGWVIGRWIERRWLDGALSFLIGVTIAFHWVMTADDLQQQRDQWHLETYLLAIGLVFLLTLIVGGACLPWVVPEFSFVRALSDGLSRTHTIYMTLLERLFAV